MAENPESPGAPDARFQIGVGNDRAAALNPPGDHRRVKYGPAQRALGRFLASRLTDDPLVIAGFTNVVLFLLTYLIFTPRFQSNDDPMMMLLAAGVGRITESSIYLNFSHVAIGWLLAFLYSVTLSIPWYALYLIAGLFAAHVVCLYCVLKRTSAATVLVLYLAFFFLVSVSLLLNLQYTISAALTAIAGFVLLILEDKPTGSNQGEARGWHQLLSWRNGIGLALVIIGSLMRYKGMALALIIVAPCFLLLVRRGNGRTVVEKGIVCGLALMLSLGLANLNRLIYAANPDCRHFLQCNDLARQFLDYGAQRRVEESEFRKMLDEEGWSTNDFWMFTSWFFMNERLYNAGSLRAMLAQLPKWNTYVGMKDITEVLKRISEERLARAAAVIFLLPLVIMRFDWRSICVLVSGWLSLLSLTVYMTLFLKPPPDWVFDPILWFAALLPLLLLNPGRTVRPENVGTARKIAGAIAVLLAVVFGMRALSAYRVESTNNARIQAAYRNLMTQMAPRRDRLYFAWTGAAAWQFMPPFGNLTLVENLIAPDSRPDQSTKVVLRHFGIDDIYLALATNDNVFLLLHTGRSELALPRYRRYMLEHYGLDVRWKKLFSSAVLEVYDIDAVSSSGGARGSREQVGRILRNTCVFAKFARY
jgi:hypothetical protein